MLFLPNIVRIIKSRELRWAGHVTRMEEGRSAFKILTDKPKGKRRLDNVKNDLINTRNWIDLT